MSRILLRKWVSRISEILISIISVITFFILDIMDVIMCVFFRVLDEFFEGKSPSCYCTERKEEEESELSHTLHGRKNFFREMGFFKIPRISSQEKLKDLRNRWSDCGCESCLDWMNSGRDSKLHFVVKEPETIDRLRCDSEETDVQNVIFIHGFLSSSSFWTETVFPNLSKDSQQKHKLFAVDLLGFGRSPKPRDCFYTLNDHLDMIEKSVILPYQLKSFHLVAHSMGCIIALGLAAKYSDSVKSITLIAPPYISSSEVNASSEALNRLATRKVWPPILFGSAFMSWYEHLGRCICFLVCRNHKTWEWILKLLTRKRDLHFAFMDLTRHTHHSAWHTMHNVICGGAKFLDKYLETLMGTEVKIRVIQGTWDQVVPLECSYNMKMKNPEIELEIIPNADHNTVILGRRLEFCRNLECLWESSGNNAEFHRGKWVSRILEILISIASAITFLILDIMDIVMCVLFRVLDKLFEGKSSSCYCMEREVIEEEESEFSLSDTLHVKKNFIREMGFLKILRISRQEKVNVLRNRWSDCGCESCLDWLNNGNCTCISSQVQLHKYLETLMDAEVKIHVVIGTRDRIVPLECSYNMKMKYPEIELHIVPNAAHTTVISRRRLEFCRNLETLWKSSGNM